MIILEKILLIHYKSEKKSPRLGTNPDKWNDTTHVVLGGTTKQLSKFYKKVEPLYAY